VNFDDLSEVAGAYLNFGRHTILAAVTNSNRLIWASARHNCDLYVGRPMGQLIGNKMYECTQALSKTNNIIDSLQMKVEFPNIRRLVNDGKIDLKEVLKFRKKGRKFRDWLQSESERDHDAIIAYHNETSKELGYVKVARRTIPIFGMALGGVVGEVVGGEGIGGAAAGGVAGNVVTGFSLDVASKIGAGWRPVVFGNWLKDRIEKAIELRYRW
jgi:hypothetical protein